MEICTVGTKAHLVLLTFIYSFSFNFVFAQNSSNCNNSKHDYTSVYTNMYNRADLGSNLITTISPYEKVGLISGSTKVTGWIEICYLGVSGWIKASDVNGVKNTSTNISPFEQMSRNEYFRKIKEGVNSRHNSNSPLYTSSSYQKNSTNLESSNRNSGTPFLAYSTTTVNMRSGPGKNYRVLRTLQKKSSIYVFSDQSTNGYYKVIDIASNDIGYVYSSYVAFEKYLEASKEGVFKNAGSSYSYNTEVLVRNKSARDIKLIVGNNVYEIPRSSNKTLNITPGSRYYIASAPGVIPASGTQIFESYSKLEWGFWIETRYK
jgi:uncharacterized protein YgiM (DUF1202 family)